ncbi:hypothetical protein RJ639_012978 [Escallonia herrerae]|uniref:BAHD acyltransferase n=1 Tax=Escallonia herrerae TaxID=1293975 RepID=A0AA89ASD7_9ASTE|nr:hypothetical protein RJ639_012978 [Escallonia herrerae]
MVRIEASYWVKPAKETPKRLMCLSDVDQVRSITHAATVYFYEKPGEFANAVDVLRDSLSKALVTFYPLAGRLRLISGGRFELDCNSKGARLLVAKSEAKIQDFGDFLPTPEIRSLIPPANYYTPIHEIPLLLVQLTKFSCGGICLGLGISNILVDGQSGLNFVTEWAKVARGEKSNNPPLLDRRILQAKEPFSVPSFEHTEFSPPRLIGQPDDLEERKKDTTVAMLELNQEEIEKLKRKANEGRTSGDTSRPYSRYEAVAGHIWRCASKARGHMSQQPTRLCTIVGFRNRMDPPLPENYFGNAIIRAAATTTSGELLSKPLHYATSKIRESIERVTDEYVRSSLVFARDQPDVSRYRNCHTVGSTEGTFYGNPSVEITTWARLPIHGTDFGWGNEIHMGSGSIGHDGLTIIRPGHDEDGSFVVTLRLQVAHMGAFKNYFYEDI